MPDPVPPATTIASLGNGLGEAIGGRLGCNAVTHIIVKPIDETGPLADGEDRRARQRGEHGLHARRGLGQDRGKLGPVLANGESGFMRDEADRRLAIMCGQNVWGAFKPLADAIDPDGAVLIDQRFHHVVSFQGGGDAIPERTLQGGATPQDADRLNSSAHDPCSITMGLAASPSGWSAGVTSSREAMDLPGAKPCAT